MSKVVLGRGLEALIPAEGKQSKERERFRLVAVDRIAPNPMQPRRDFGEDSLRQLAESFKHNGIMQPLIVKRSGDTYIIVAGERRLRAAKLAGISEIPVLLTEDIDERRMLELALAENLQRADLNPLEMAEAYQTLIDRCGLTQNELADRVGKSRAAVANTLRLLSLPDEVKRMIRDGKLAEGHARAILAAGSEDDMVSLAKRALAEALSVRDVEQAVGRHRAKTRRIPRRDPVLADTETYLKQLLATSVRIHHGPRKGRIEIEYYGDQDLDRLLTLFRKIASW